MMPNWTNDDGVSVFPRELLEAKPKAKPTKQKKKRTSEVEGPTIGAHPCAWCKFPKTLSEYCSCACKDLGEAYQRGKADGAKEERAAVVAVLRREAEEHLKSRRKIVAGVYRRAAWTIEKGEHEVKR